MTGKKPEAEARKQRLAKALKANIARRKQAVKPAQKPGRKPAG